LAFHYCIIGWWLFWQTAQNFAQSKGLKSMDRLSPSIQTFSSAYGNYNPPISLPISTSFNGPLGACFGGVVLDIATKMALVNGCKPTFEARSRHHSPNYPQYI
jgi:hypothetical protein